MTSFLYNKLDKVLLYILIVLFPIFILPVFPNPFITGKLTLISALIMAILAIKSIKSNPLPNKVPANIVLQLKAVLKSPSFTVRTKTKTSKLTI